MATERSVGGRDVLAHQWLCHELADHAEHGNRIGCVAGKWRDVYLVAHDDSASVSAIIERLHDIIASERDLLALRHWLVALGNCEQLRLDQSKEWRGGEDGWQLSADEIWRAARDYIRNRRCLLPYRVQLFTGVLSAEEYALHCGEAAERMRALIAKQFVHHLIECCKVEHSLRFGLRIIDLLLLASDCICCRLSFSMSLGVPCVYSYFPRTASMGAGRSSDMGAGASCRGNTFNGLVSKLRQSKCVAGPFTVIGLVQPTLPPVLLFGERHDARDVGSGCTLLSSLLLETLSCDSSCAEQMHIFLEAEEEDFAGHQHMPFDERAVDEDGKFTIALNGAKRLAQEWLEACGARIHFADLLYEFRGVEPNLDEHAAKVALVDTAAKIVHLFFRTTLAIDPHAATAQQCFDLLYYACWDVIAEADSRVAEGAFTHMRALREAALSNDDPQWYADQKFVLLCIVTDVLAVTDMLSTRDSSCNIGYWGAMHARGQAGFLEDVGYVTVLEWSNEAEGAAFFEGDVAGRLPRERRASVPLPNMDGV
ncbi:hypothetical protein JKP88DRAFT_255157 [Tribonema minus]|uniref:Uncharacterized protein n=1 Tax=Tribonema minus TaxID=303371 RepID=A0A836CGI1_9STRA|nr:hypothetical protein JKP88DRAFT_255157 [Tribonema minus]